MRQRGQTTTYQTRLEINEHTEARVERHTNRNGSWVLNLDCTQMATTIAQAWTRGPNLTDGTSGHWSTE